MNASGVTSGLAESNGKLLLGIWRDSLHVTCGLTACTPGSAPGPTLGNEYGKNFTFTFTCRLRESVVRFFLFCLLVMLAVIRATAIHDLVK